MSVERKPEANGHSQSRRLEIRAQSRDARLPSQERGLDESRPAVGDDPNVLDMDFFLSDEIRPSRGRGSSKKTHVFGQAESYRGNEDVKDNGGDDEDEGYIRARQRAAGLPLVHK